MGIFKKRVNANAAEDAFKELYVSMISSEEMESHKDKLEQLKGQYSALNQVHQSTFNEHLTGANLAILDFAWNKFQISNRIDIVSEFMNFGIRKSQLHGNIPGLSKYDDAEAIYTEAIMRTPPGDAFTEIAKDFFKALVPNYKQINVSKITPLVDLFRDEFGKVYLVYIENFKMLKLIY